MQTVSCAPDGAAASCTTAGVTTTTGNLFIASAGYCCAAFTSVTDNKGNSYTDSVAEQSDAGGGSSRQQYKESGAGGASHTFTLTGASGAFFGALSVTEVSGAATSGALDQTAGGITNPGDTSHTTNTTSTTTQANELLLGYGSTANVATFTTDTGAGWTELTNIATDADTEGLITGYRIVSATGTFAYTYTTNVARDTTQGISTWKEASGRRQRCIGCGIDKKVIGE